MKAIRAHSFGGPDVLRLEDVDDPKPGRGEALVEVHAVGINPVDTYIRSGTYAVKPELPYTPGFDGAGVVRALGPELPASGPIAVGDRVYFGGSLTGTYAEQTLCETRRLYRLPDESSFVSGAAVAVPYATAYRALVDRARARAGETVLVHGATGGVGTAALQLARSFGMRVIGTGGTETGRELARREGAHEVLDHHAPNYLDALLELTNGEGVDVVLEMLANVNLGRDLTVLARGGRVVVIGSRGTVEVNPRDLMGREGEVLGMVLLNASVEELAATHAAIFAGLEAGTLKPVVGRELALADAAEAHRVVLEPGASGNLVLRVDR